MGNVDEADAEAQVGVGEYVPLRSASVGDAVGTDDFSSVATPHVGQRDAPALNHVVEAAAVDSGAIFFECA